MKPDNNLIFTVVLLQKRKLELVFSGISIYLVSSSEEECKSVFRLCQQCHSNHLLRENQKLRQSLNKSFRCELLSFCFIIH